MDFEPTARIRNTIVTVDEFVERELFPLEPRFLSEPVADLLPDLTKLRGRVKEMGLWAPAQPREVGGMGLDLVDFGLLSEALGRSPLGHYVFGCQAPDAGNIEILHRYGTARQKTRWLEPLAAGEIRSCFSMTEVEMPGSNPVRLDTSAVRDGADYVINGRKWYTTAADGAAFAVVMAVTNPEAAKHRRASMILVPTDTPGFDLVRNLSVMGHVGDDFASHAEIEYRDCRVPTNYRLGPEGAGFVIAQERLGPGRIHHTMRWLGICRRSMDLMCDRALTRQITDDKTLSDMDIVRTWIAESAAEIAAARQLTLHTAWLVDRNGFKAARKEISMIKFLVAGTLQRVVDRALQAHGGLGMTDDTPLAFFYRQERAARIYDGPDEVHKLAVARSILNETVRRIG